MLFFSSPRSQKAYFRISKNPFFWSQKNRPLLIQTLPYKKYNTFSLKWTCSLPLVTMKHETNGKRIFIIELIYKRHKKWGPTIPQIPFEARPPLVPRSVLSLTRINHTSVTLYANPKINCPSFADDCLVFTMPILKKAYS